MAEKIMDITESMERSLEILNRELVKKQKRDEIRINILKNIDKTYVRDSLRSFLAVLNEEKTEIELVHETIRRLAHMINLGQLRDDGNLELIHNALENISRGTHRLKKSYERQRRICIRNIERHEKENPTRIASDSYTELIAEMNREYKTLKDAIERCNKVLPTLIHSAEMEKQSKSIELEGQRTVLPGHDLIFPLAIAIFHRFIMQKQFLDKYKKEMM